MLHRHDRRLTLVVVVTLVAGWPVWWQGPYASAQGANQQPSTSQPARPRRVVVLTLDGVPKWLVDPLIAQGGMPNLAALIAEGSAAAYTTSNFPNCTTPPGHAALYTGCYGIDNGITGFMVPRTPPDKHDLTEFTLGFDARLLRAEPLWVSLARAGKPSLLIHAPHSLPLEPFGTWQRFGGDFTKSLRVFSGYSGNRLARDAVYTAAALNPHKADSTWSHLIVPPQSLEFHFEVGQTRFAALVFDDPADPTIGYDTVLVAPANDRDATKAARLKPPASQPQPLGLVPTPLDPEDSATARLWLPSAEGQAGAGFALRLLALDSASGQFRLWRSQCYEPATNLTGDQLASLLAQAGPFVGNGAGYALRDGALGPLLTDQPVTDSALVTAPAEWAYLQTVAVMTAHQTQAMRWAMANQPEGLIVGYLPIPDEAGHIWAGYLDPDCPGYDPRRARQILPLWRAVAAQADAFLGAVRQAAGPDTAIVISSDHGMRGFSTVARPNVILRLAGLQGLDARGRIDLSASQAVYHMAGHGYVGINTTDRKGGIVPPEQKAQVVAAVKRALLAATDSQGRPLLSAVLDADPPEGRLGLGQPNTGDLFLVPAAGVKLEPFADGAIASPAKSAYTGHHDALPTDAPLRTLMVFSGPGIARGKVLGPVRHIDLAPTVLHLLGVPAPQSMTGRVLVEALDPASHN